MSRSYRCAHAIGTFQNAYDVTCEWESKLSYSYRTFRKPLHFGNVLADRILQIEKRDSLHENSASKMGRKQRPQSKNLDHTRRVKVRLSWPYPRFFGLSYGISNMLCMLTSAQSTKITRNFWDFFYFSSTESNTSMYI